MRLAVITDEIDADLHRALTVMEEYGVRGAELRQIWDKNIADAPPDYLKRAKDLLDSHGMQVVGIASPFYKCDLPGEGAAGPVGPLHSAASRGLADQMSLLDHCIDTARFFDTSLVRIFSFWKRGSLTPAIEDRIVDALAEPASIAEDSGIVLGLENEHACYLATGAQTARVIEKVNSAALRAVWDLGNAFMDGEVPYPTGYEAIRDFVTHVHIKDARVADGAAAPVWTVVGEGQIDYRGQLMALERSGYAGYVSLETHYLGAEGKEASSRACLEALITLMNSRN